MNSFTVIDGVVVIQDNSGNVVSVVSNKLGTAAHDGSGNALTSTSSKMDVALSDGAGTSITLDNGRFPTEAVIQGVTGDRAEVTAAGELKVSTSIPIEPPAGFNRVERDASSTLGNGDTDDTTYVITNTKEIEIVFFKSGAETNTDGSKTFLYYAPNGTLDGSESLIDFAYHNGATVAPSNPGLTFEGDGTAAIIARRENLGGGAVEITFLWIGFEEI